MEPGRDRPADGALHDAPVVDDLRVAEPEDGVAAQPQLGIMGDVARALSAGGMELVAVDLHDQSIADEHVDRATADPHLLPNAEPLTPERDHEEGLETRIGESGDRLRQLPRRTRSPLDGAEGFGGELLDARGRLSQHEREVALDAQGDVEQGIFHRPEQ